MVVIVGEIEPAAALLELQLSVQMNVHQNTIAMINEFESASALLKEQLSCPKVKLVKVSTTVIVVREPSRFRDSQAIPSTHRKEKPKLSCRKRGLD